MLVFDYPSGLKFKIVFGGAKIKQLKQEHKRMSYKFRLLNIAKIIANLQLLAQTESTKFYKFVHWVHFLAR